jgi:hypothetical protein
MTDAITFLHGPNPSDFTRKASRGVPGMNSRIKGKKWSDRVDFVGLSAFLRAEHPAKTPQAVEAKTDIPADTVKKWLGHEAAPSGGNLLTLALVYGPQVLAACIKGAPAWLDAATRAEMARKLKDKIAADQRTLHELTDL